jgi:predicted nucleotidyltransferase
MRLTNQQAKDIARLAHQMAGETARVRLFGSRLDDDAKGGDIDLLLEIPEPVTDPALVAARFAAQVTRLMRGRKVDVLLAAPNLERLPIHEVALSEGRLL